MTIGPIRTFLSCKGSDDKSLMSLSRSLGLYVELIGKISERTGFEQSEIANIECVRSAEVFPIENDSDVCRLCDGDLVVVTKQERRELSTILKEHNEHMSQYFTREYVEEHWVSAAAGYYAVTGKMSAEEENRLLLEIVEAFKHEEDINPAVSCEESIAAPKRKKAGPRPAEKVADSRMDSAALMSFIPPGEHLSLNDLIID
jgi:hypothetical protein